MLIVPTVNYFGWDFNNYGTNPSATPGTSVTPGINNAEGAWTQIATSANINTEVWALHLAISGGNTTAVAKNHFVDIGIDPAGGTAYTPLISNVICGMSQTGSTGSTQSYFPIKIPSGSAVAVRCQGYHSTAGTIRVAAKFYGKPSLPEIVYRGEYCETVGQPAANTSGVAFSPGNAADGAWATLGTTTRNLHHWNLGVGISNAIITAQYTWVDLAYGDATNKVIIIKNKFLSIYGTAEIQAEPLTQHIAEGYCPVPSGSTLYVRGRCSTAPATGYHALAIGIG